jgi:hypothetical protein
MGHKGMGNQGSLHYNIRRNYLTVDLIQTTTILKKYTVFLFILTILSAACRKDEIILRPGVDYQVWVASPWQRVLRSTPPGILKDVNIKAAANEYQPFRIILFTGNLQLNDVSMSVSDLKSNNADITADNIKLYRANYLYISKPSYNTNNPVGWYPDALIPFPDPHSGGKPGLVTYLASPFSTGQNVEVWCDLFVPPGTQAGVYTGSVTVLMGEKKLAEVPINLTVWNFELPAKISMPSYFGSLNSTALGMMGISGSSGAATAMEVLYEKELLKHRAVPATPSNVWPAWSESQGIIENGEAERMRRLIEEDHFNALNIPFRYKDDSVKCKAYLSAMAAWLRKLGYLDMSYIYMEDEPNDASEYEIVRKQGALIRAADPGIGRLCTEQTITQNPAWGNLYGAVSIWCPLWGYWDESTAKERLASGEKLWSYTALCQKAKGTPWWQIDMEPLNFRSPFWLSWHYGITGFLYWSSVYWNGYVTLKGVWEAPYFRNDFWGEGMLLYPGLPAGVNGFVPSIRLKLYREAMEDYEYMTIARNLGKDQEVDRIVDEIVTNFQVWSRDMEAYELARERLAGLILQSK